MLANFSAIKQRMMERLFPRTNRIHGADAGPVATWATEGPNEKRASEAPSKKASSAGPLIAFQNLHRPVWTPRDYQAFAREGFMQNAIVYRCVRMIAESAASVPLLLYDRDVEIEDHPLLSLIRRPNPSQTRSDLIETLLGHLLVSGNAYLEAVAIDGAVREIHVLRPDRMQIVPGPDGWPEAYDYTVAGRTVRIAGEAAPGIPRMLHFKQFHPDNDHYGMSPLEAAATAIDLHNTAARWNKALLDNSARPSGALVYTSRDGNMTAEQYERLKVELEQGFQGATNAGRPLLLEGGLDWKSMALSPKDMDFIEARHVAAREIALALGVPPMLLGIPGDNTYSNMAEAQRIFWRTTVLPLVERIAKALSGWLGGADAKWASEAQSKIEFRPDLDALPPLAPEREALWSSLEKTSFLTDDEKRALIGYGPKPSTAKFNPHHLPAGPGGGQFTTAPDDEGDGSERPQPAQSRGPRNFGKPPAGGGGGKRPGPGHNNPPGPIPVPPIIPPPGFEKPRLLDENGQAAPRGFDNLKDLNAFKERLAQDLPSDVSAVMQGSAVEQGGANFRDKPQGDQTASDFDVSLSGEHLYERAVEAFPGSAKTDRVGPLKVDQIEKLGIDVRGVEQSAGRDVRFMIYPSQIELYRRGPGFPLVTR